MWSFLNEWANGPRRCTHGVGHTFSYVNHFNRGEKGICYISMLFGQVSCHVSVHACMRACGILDVFVIFGSGPIPQCIWGMISASFPIHGPAGDTITSYIQVEFFLSDFLGKQFRD